MAADTNDPQMLRNLASALRDAGKQAEQLPKLPAATDEDILRAMLGKPWGTRPAQPVRKAG